MYATSKLIIPPKPARNSPYIPKLRIKLKPSLNRNRLVHGTSLRNSALVQLSRGDVVLRSAHSPRNLAGGLRSSSKVSETPSAAAVCCETESRDESEAARGDGDRSTPITKRTGSKRKQSVLEMDSLNLEGPESVLTKVSLKALINRDTFYAFPVETQKMLADLLPYYDRQKQSWPANSSNGYTEDDSRVSSELVATISPEDASVWLHPSALSNEFFTKALQDYSDRQSRGEFAPRLRNRAGLRANAVGRGRYGTAVVNADFISGKHTLKHSVMESNSNYDLVRRTTRVKNKAYASLSRQAKSRSRNRAVESGGHSSPSSEKLPRSLAKDARRSQNLSSSKKLVRERMKLHEKTAQSLPTDRASSEESPTQASPQTVHTDIHSSSDFLSRSPGCPHHPISAYENDPACGNSNSLTPKMTKTSPCEVPNNTFRNSMARNSSFNSPQGLDLCDGLDTSYSLAHAHKQDEPMLSPKSSRRSNCSPSTSSTTSDFKPQNVLGSPRSGRSAKGLSSTPDSSVPPSMPPPRQTKTLAAMREKLRAKRMMKEAERHPSGSSCYSLPGSMTPHPASGACGYFHQPSGYPPSGVAFGSPLLPSIGVKRSSSTLSSPQNPNSTSPTNCDKQPYNTATSVSLCTLLNGTIDPIPSKLIPNSPSSPHSLPNTELSSPLLNSSLNNDFLSHISLQDSCTFGQEFSGQSYPSSPLSTNSSSGVLAGSAVPTGSAYSPQPVKTTVPVIHPEVRQEQSVSAPPTPVLPQAGQTMLTFSPLAPSSTPCSSLQNSGSARIIQQTALSNPIISVTSVAQGLPISHPTHHLQTHNSTRPMLSSTTSVNSSASGSATVVLSVDSVPVPSITNHLPPPAPQPQPPLSALSSSSSSSVVTTTISDLRTSHSYPTLTTVSSCASSVLTSTSSATSVDAMRSQQTTVATAASLTTQLSASAAVTKFLVGSSQNRPSTTTRAFFVDGDNLSEAVALLQSLNPKATITQQQFLLIPSSNKSQMFLCPTPSTSTPNILSVPVSTSAPSTTTQSNGSNVSVPSAAVGTLNAKSIANQNVLPTANLSGVRQLSVGSLNTLPNQMTVNQVVPSATTTVTALDPKYSLHSKMVNMILPGVASNPMTPSTTHGARSLICTKSVMSYPQSNATNLVHLKPQPKPVMDNTPDRVVNKTTVVMPKRSVAPVSKSVTDTVYATPVTQSQIAFSLLAPNTSVLNNETPLMFVSEAHPASYPPRQLNLNATQPSVASLDRSQTLLSPMNNIGSTPIAPTVNPVSSSAPIAASGQMTVLNPTQLAPSRDLHLQSQQQQQRMHSVSAQLNSSSVASEQTVQTIRATSISYASGVGPGSVPTYLSAATIVSPCLPAVVLPHTLTVQSQRTNVIATNHGTSSNHCVNGTDHALFRSIP